MKGLAAALGLGLIALSGPALAGDPDRAALFIGALRDNGCAMSEAEAAEMMPALGFEQDETREFVEVLYQATLVGFNDDFSTLSLALELCEGDPALDSATYVEALADFDATAVEVTDDELVAMLRDEMGVDFARGAAAFVASNEGCGLDYADPAQTEAKLVDFVVDYLTQVLGLTGPIGDAPMAEIRAMVAGFLAEPEPEFTIQDGRLALNNCTP